ncbi:3'(2'),5'-bisphosphate nucleotidase CysQ [Ancylobacter sp. 6x-1]|uniref:3'(2'),5'-bisphosphate nucleotidase CysQ n=1 Tax=Ancylobacter crimeensis TaxID=2579147 RepID=A0ABT0DDE6_9HYPH|nr:3'(2'),5'-bisphosphate nucleotidase CysQ [Ancylobacter crimeensis]MCK0197986.1 3'(2'),5'-bisphosphate nucleotidase CysQ [Ancylobacter crimeensis]
MADEIKTGPRSGATSGAGPGAADARPYPRTDDTDLIADPAIAARHLADAAVAGGAVAVAMFRGGIRSWSKDNNSPVTEADLAVDAMLRERLTGLAPDYGWLSEETADNPERLGRRRLWIVDPIDGTRSYMAGRPDWCVAVALVEDGRPIAGALYAPVTDELFIAFAGGGATRNGLPIAAGTRQELAGARLDAPPPLFDRVQAVAPVARGERVHSLALRNARVATGELDAALASPNANDWDLAAADLLVHEAGGLLTTLSGNRLVYNASVPRHGALVSAGASLHPSVLDAARRGTS